VNETRKARFEVIGAGLWGREAGITLMVDSSFLAGLAIDGGCNLYQPYSSSNSRESSRYKALTSPRLGSSGASARVSRLNRLSFRAVR
jgi:hypothetical protein